VEPRAERAAVAGGGREELFFPPGGNCFGCSPSNPAGLHLRFFRDTDGIVCETTIGAAHQGAPNVVHGGIQAVLLDEACCATVAFTTGDSVVTGELNLRYHRPCPTGIPLAMRAHIVRDEGRYLVVRADLRNADAEKPFTSSEGRFYRDRRRART
jgi:uncharacterized protein (TIGR00369 family)